MSPFPFLRLPLLPMINALDMMDGFEIVRLSLCSEKTRKVIKTVKKAVSLDSLWKKQADKIDVLGMIDLLLLETSANSQAFFQKYQTSIDVCFGKGFSFTISVLNPPIKMRFRIFVYNKTMHSFYKERIDGYWKLDGDVNIPFTFNEDTKDTMYTFWDSEAEGFKVMADYFNWILNPKIRIEIYGEILGWYSRIWRMLTHWMIGNGGYSHNLRTVIEWMSSNQKPVEQCEIHRGELINDEDYKLILGNKNLRKIVDKSAKRSDDFVYHGTINTTYLNISNARWFNIDNLFNADCKEMHIFGTQLKNEDLKKYVDAWMAGRFLKLKLLEVDIQEHASISVILSGLSKYERSLTWKSSKLNTHIRRRDGNIAKITLDNYNLGSFKMIV